VNSLDREIAAFEVQLPSDLVDRFRQLIQKAAAKKAKRLPHASLKARRRAPSVKAMKDEYRRTHSACACCLAVEGEWHDANHGAWPPDHHKVHLDLNHMISGAQGTKGEGPAGYIMLCRRCHERLDKSFGLPYCMYLKDEMGELDLEWLAEHHHVGRLPEMKVVPAEWRRR